MAYANHTWVKEQLRRRGLYISWSKLRREFIDRGRTHSDAAQLALQRVAPDLDKVELDKVPEIAAFNAAMNQASLQRPHTGHGMPPADPKSGETPPLMHKMGRVRSEPLRGNATKADFEGCAQEDEAEAILWVAENLHLSDVTIKDAPGPISWGLLCHVRSSGVFRDLFWKEMYLKIALQRIKDQEAAAEDTDGGKDAAIASDTELLERYQAALETRAVCPPDTSQPVGEPAAPAPAHTSRAPF